MRTKLRRQSLRGRARGGWRPGAWRRRRRGSRASQASRMSPAARAPARRCPRWAPAEAAERPPARRLQTQPRARGRRGSVATRRGGGAPQRVDAAQRPPRRPTTATSSPPPPRARATAKSASGVSSQVRVLTLPYVIVSLLAPPHLFFPRQSTRKGPRHSQGG